MQVLVGTKGSLESFCPVFLLFDALQQHFGFFGVVPEVRSMTQRLLLPDVIQFTFDVKDTPSALPRALSCL